MSREPIRSQLCNLCECAPLLEQMGCTRNDLELSLAFHQCHRIAIHLEDRCILASNDEQCWSTDQGCVRACQIRSASARHYCLYRLRPPGSRHKRCRRPRACAEQADPMPANLSRTFEPVRNRHQTPREKVDIETQLPSELVLPFLLGC